MGHDHFVVLIPFHLFEVFQAQLQVVQVLDLVETSVATHDDHPAGAGFKVRLQRLFEQCFSLVAHAQLSNRVEFHLQWLPTQDRGVAALGVGFFLAPSFRAGLQSLDGHLREWDPGQGAVVHADDQTFHIRTIGQLVVGVGVDQDTQTGLGSGFRVPTHRCVAGVGTASGQVGQHGIHAASQTWVLTGKVDAEPIGLLVTGTIAHAQIHLDGEPGDGFAIGQVGQNHHGVHATDRFGQ